MEDSKLIIMNSTIEYINKQAVAKDPKAIKLVTLVNSYDLVQKEGYIILKDK